MARRNRYLFICINRRPDDNPKGCCAAKGSEEVYKALKAEVAARGLAQREARLHIELSRSMRDRRYRFS
jgi:hypothetical protein